MEIKLAAHQKHTSVITEALLQTVNLYDLEVTYNHGKNLATHYRTGGHYFKTRKEFNEHLIDFLNATYHNGNFDLTPIKTAKNSYNENAFEIID